MEGETGLALALSSRADIVLLDIMLPKVNGYEVCREVRAAGLEVPIIMLTAKSQEEDVVLGLNLGADDYVTKPFKIRELVARVNAFLRRSQVKQTSSCSFSSYKLDLAARTLFRSEEEVQLTTKEFSLLALFCRLSRTGFDPSEHPEPGMGEFSDRYTTKRRSLCNNITSQDRTRPS